MPVKFQKHLLRLWEELCSQGTYYYMHFHSTEAKSMLKVKNVKKSKKKKKKKKKKVISGFC